MPNLFRSFILSIICCLFNIVFADSASAQKLSIERITDAMAGSASLLQRTDTAHAKLLNELQIQVRDLSDHLLASGDKANGVYLQILFRYSQVLDSLSRLKEQDSASIRKLRYIVADFRLKNANNTAWQIAETKDHLTIPVEIITRQLLDNGQFRLVNGYKVYANPWVDSVRKPAKVNFQNSTNPGTNDYLPPGRYFIWAVPVIGKPKNYPLHLDYTDIPYTASGERQTIYIDITSDEKVFKGAQK